ncbi:ATPase [Clostridium gelidum]|uniref:ATPase n=1 Tax=Clostridium gelidum TaxID=704125 RepID=A0ABM7T6X1_9CLOT|nr:cation-translocating P-type ATPase [Clostridium gelidum]BCZ44673.1 ATPase [Clostridium gelidum]
MTEQEKNEIMKGLTSYQVRDAQERFGKNQLIIEKKESLFRKILEVLAEPMFLLLLVASIIYFILGEPQDGAIMLVFVLGIISIDVVQEWKTDKTLKALKDLSAPHITVVRDGKEILINSENLVPGDLMLISEGVKIPADGKIISCNDLCVDESSLTGESEGTWKTSIDKKDKDIENNKDYWKRDYCYAGTLVVQGNATVVIDKIGSMTEYGKIGVNIVSTKESKTLLQKQTGKLVKLCAGIAAVLFALVSIVTYLNLSGHILKDRIIESILSGITLAMAMIPEEFPVILTVFLSMGAWRLAKKQSLVRKLPSVETLGAVSVLCVDKTGTITMNKMTVQDNWALNDNKNELCKIMGMACETEAYDPMEKAMLSYCECLSITRDYLFSGNLLTEYPFTNETKMMGHVWEKDGEITIASKGSAEKILTICKLNTQQRIEVEAKILKMSSKGLRVIAVGIMKVKNNDEVPESLLQCNLTLCGLIGLADPPRESIKDDIKNCIKAGIRVVMITGDNGITASSIAKQIGMIHSNKIITGDELNLMNDEELREKVKDVSVFSRVVPEHKMRIVKAFKENGEIVAMTGDGVNDAPALKFADIGIAMGKRGSEVSREAADLILLDDNFSTIIDTVKDGRRIYDNIRKAVGYVFTIHIPIAFASLLAPLLGINAGALLLLPVHVVLLELIIDPTCSIVLERQAAERDIMKRKPRNSKENIITSKSLMKSIIQGIIIFIASFGTYYLYLDNNINNATVARSMGLVIIFISNIILVQVNSSDTDLAYKSFMINIKDRVMWMVNIGTILGILLIVYTPISSFLKLTALSFNQLLIAIGISIIAVMWYEIVKIIKQ